MSLPPPIVRFAPSPTGLLHIGNVRTALINWLFARRHGGSFVLRLDDTDHERSQEIYAHGIREDLTWLGLIWDHTFRQSDRLARYGAAAETLKSMGRLYPCYESATELDLKRKRQLSQGLPPVYDRAALRLTADDHDKMAAAGRKPHWRFRLLDDTVSWDDLAHGPIAIDTKSMSDPILIREDRSPVYTLSSVVDDLDTGVTHILRGEDHISNTAVQIQLYGALGGDRSHLTFSHTPLIVGENGEGLSKRLGSLSIQSLREKGVEPLALLSYLARLGTSDDITAAGDIRELIDHFDIGHYGRSSPRFSEETLMRLNGKVLHGLSPDVALDRLAQMGYDVSESFWQAVRGNVTTFHDVVPLLQIIHGPIHPVITQEDGAFVAAALTHLPEGDLNDQTWSLWTAALKGVTGRTGRSLFMPLRLALTGQDHGPDMKSFLPLIPRDRIVARLRGEDA